MDQKAFLNAQKHMQSSTPTVGGVLQRKCDTYHRKRLLQRAAAGPAPETVPPIVHEVLRSPGAPLDAETRAFMEPRFGHDFSQVRVHKDAQAEASARSLHATAYTVGNDIAFALSAYAPATAAGTRLLAHELSHVVQQGYNGKRIQCWGDSTHKEVTQRASDVLRDEDVVPAAASKSQFVEELSKYSVSTDWKARRILWTGALFLSGAVEGEGPNHGEDGNYAKGRSREAAKAENVNKQQQYIEESVRYYRQLMSAPREEQAQGGPAASRSDAWQDLSIPGLGVVSGAMAGTLYGAGAARAVSRAVGGGFGGALLGSLVGLVTVPVGLAVGSVAGALGIGAFVSAGKSKPASNAREGVLAALGDACHVAQDRASHWEGVRGRGHTDARTQSGWNPDDKNENPGDKPGDFGGYLIAIGNTRDVLRAWTSRRRSG